MPPQRNEAHMAFSFLASLDLSCAYQCVYVGPTADLMSPS